MRVAEAAERLEVSTRHVYSLIDRDELPGGMRLGRAVMVAREPFAAFLRGEMSVCQWQARNATPGRNSRA